MTTRSLIENPRGERVWLVEGSVLPEGYLNYSVIAQEEDAPPEPTPIHVRHHDDEPADPRTAELVGRFTYHAPTGNQPERYEQIRATALAYAILLVESTPESREQSLALTHLEQVVFFANAAIARREHKS